MHKIVCGPEATDVPFTGDVKEAFHSIAKRVGSDRNAIIEFRGMPATALIELTSRLQCYGLTVMADGQELPQTVVLTDVTPDRSLVKTALEACCPHGANPAHRVYGYVLKNLARRIWKLP